VSIGKAKGEPDGGGGTTEKTSQSTHLSRCLVRRLNENGSLGDGGVLRQYVPPMKTVSLSPCFPFLILNSPFCICRPPPGQTRSNRQTSRSNLPPCSLHHDMTNLAIPMRFLTQMNARRTGIRGYAVFSSQSLGSFVANSSLLAARPPSIPLRRFPGANPNRSNPVKPFFNLDHRDVKHPPSPIRSAIKSGSPGTCGLQEGCMETRGNSRILPILHSAFCILHFLHHSIPPLGVRGSKPFLQQH
jgi:hypothetical protein